MLRLSHWLVEHAKWLVPPRQRDDWCEMWKAELWHHAHEQPDANGLDLMRRSLGALSHALWLAGREWRLSNVYQDLMYGLRAWLLKPLFTAVALLTLALGIGANTYIYSVVDGVLLNPFPYRDVDRLVAIGAAFPQFSNETRFIEAVSVPDFLEIERQSETLTDFLAFDLGNRDFGGSDISPVPERLFTAAVWGDPFRTLGMKPAVGRSFTAEEIDNREPVAIVSHRVWQTHFGGSASALGRTVVINGAPYTLVGVMPPRLVLLDSDLWVPMWYSRTEMPRSRRVLTVLARVDGTVELEAARSELEMFADRIERDLASESPEYAGFRLSATPFVDVWASFVGPAAPLLLGAVGFVLLIVCANIAGLLLARAAARRHEMAIRTAIGAGRGRLLQQLLTESSLLAIGGGVLGVLFAHGALKLTMAHLPANLPLGGIEVGINAGVLTHTLAVSIVAGLFFGVVPAFQSARVDVQQNLVSGTRTNGSASATVARRVFVALQIALCLVLLVGAGLLIKSFSNLSHVDPGVVTDNVLTMRLTLAWERYQGRFTTFYSELIDEVERIPGVRSVAMATQFPPIVRSDQPFRIEGRAIASDTELPNAFMTVVSPGLFDTLGMKLVRGRVFDQHATEHHTDESPQVVLINEAAKRRYFPFTDPLGVRIKTGDDDYEAPWAEIIGIVSDTRNRGIDSEPAPEVFVSYLQRGQWSNQMFLLVRTESDIEPMAMLAPVRTAVTRIDPYQPVYAIETLTSRFDSTVVARRAIGIVLTALSGVALLLAAMGIYAVVAFMVTEKEQELGIRIALGASSQQLLVWVLRRTGTLVLAGVALGVVGALTLARTMSSFLFEVSPYDPQTLAVTGFILIVVALAAALAPARRATRINPIETFK